MKKINILILSIILLTTSCHLPDNTTDYVDKLVVFGKLDMLYISADDYIEMHKKFKIEKNDLLLSIVGSIGRVSKTPKFYSSILSNSD